MDGDIAQLLIQGAHQHRRPESADGAPGLPMALEPRKKEPPSSAGCPRSATAFPAQSRACRAPRAAETREMKARSAAAPPARGRKRSAAASRLDVGQPVVPAYALFHAEAVVKVEQVGAAAEQHVLAVIHHLAGAGMHVRRSAAAEIRTALEECNSVSGIGECTARRQARQAAANDAHSLPALASRVRLSGSPASLLLACWGGCPGCPYCAALKVT